MDDCNTDSVYMAHWPGLLGILTQGDISVPRTWSREEFDQAFVDVGIKPPSWSFGLEPDSNVLEQDTCAFDDVHHARAVMEFFGASGRLMKEVLDNEVHVHRREPRDMDDMEWCGWSHELRRMDRPDAWTDSQVEELLTTTLSERTIQFGATRSDVAALAWIMATMSDAQQMVLKPTVSYVLMRVLQVDHSDIKDAYIVEAISDCFALIPKALVDKALMMRTLSISVVEYCLTRCGKDAVAELGWERVGDDELRAATCPHLLIETFFEFFHDEFSCDQFSPLLSDGFQTTELEEVVDEYLEYHATMRFYVGPSLADVWKCHVARSFWIYWYDVDFRLYLPFLRVN
jgi:hypothetical protein